MASSERLAVRSGDNSTLFLDLADIDWVGAAGNYVEIHVGARSHLVRQTLAETAAQLPPERFERVHRGSIVNVDRICELRGTERDTCVVLRSGAAIPVGKSFRGALEARLRAGTARSGATMLVR
jgi:two-component system, LytTR family, response regulator